MGWELYRPIGTDWLTNGYWRVAEPYGNAPDTVGQYLGIEQRKYEPYVFLNGDYKLTDEVYHTYDPEGQFQHKSITFETFKEMQFDYIVASHPLHNVWEGLLKYQPKAKFIMQLGNEGQTTKATNVLCSAADFVPESHQKVVRYHQEFDLSEYIATAPTNHQAIKSFVVSLPEPETYQLYKNALPEFDFKAYGVGSPDGTIHGGLIPEMMRGSAFGYHVKPQDGYGHVIHKWYASGRPIITRASYYKGKMASPLLTDQETCIDLDSHTFEENVRLIRYWSQPENHQQMCQNAANRFHDIVNFEREAEQIKQWIAII